MATFNLTGGTLNLYNASNLQVANMGQVTGTMSVGLTETSEGAHHTVFAAIQQNPYSGAQISVAGEKDKNYLFTGYNFDASFGSNSQSYYNVELDSANSKFDFSGNQYGAIVSTTQRSANNVVQLGGGKNVVFAENIDANLGVSGQVEQRAYNNMVIDSGSSNVFLSSADSATRFETTQTSKGAFIAGGDLQDTYVLNGIYGVAYGGSGYNIFNTTGTSAFNVAIGGVGTNAYNDYGIKNMYQGAYAFNQYGINGDDTIRFNGYYGIARIGTTNLTGATSAFHYNSGSWNAGFTGDSATLENGTVIDYRQLLNGTYADYNKSDGTTWTLRDFYSANSAPTGYAGYYSSMLLQQILE